MKMINGFAEVFLILAIATIIYLIILKVTERHDEPQYPGLIYDDDELYDNFFYVVFATIIIILILLISIFV